MVSGINICWYFGVWNLCDYLPFWSALSAGISGYFSVHSRMLLAYSLELGCEI